MHGHSTPALTLGRPLSSAAYADLRARMAFEGFKWDIQIGDHPALGRQALVLSVAETEKIFRFAETLWEESQRIERWASTSDEWRTVLGLPRKLKRSLVWRESAMDVPRIARFDFHLTTAGWKVSEVNADVPGGLIEASLLPEFWPDIPAGCASAGNVGEAYISSLVPFLERGAVGLLHAPWYSDDRQQMDFLASVLRQRGVDAIAVGPEQVQFTAAGANAFGVPLQAMLRFFPCEWLIRLRGWEAWFASAVPISNPLWGIISQAKRLPLIWDRLPFEVATWRQLLPLTMNVGLRDLFSDLRVIKPSLGRVGEGVYLPGISTAREKRKILLSAFGRPKEWIAQERFEIVNLGTAGDPAYPCLGVYVIGGRASGIYGRVSRTGLTNEAAVDCPVFVKQEGQC